MLSEYLYHRYIEMLRTFLLQSCFLYDRTIERISMESFAYIRYIVYSRIYFKWFFQMVLSNGWLESYCCSKRSEIILAESMGGCFLKPGRLLQNIIHRIHHFFFEDVVHSCGSCCVLGWTLSDCFINMVKKSVIDKCKKPWISVAVRTVFLGPWSRLYQFGSRLLG